MWHTGRVFGLVCVASGKVVGCPSGCLGVFVSRRLVDLGSVASGSITSWTASAEPALGHPAVFLTTRAFYSSDFGSATGQRSRSFLLVRRSSLILYFSISLSTPSTGSLCF